MPGTEDRDKPPLYAPFRFGTPPLRLDADLTPPAPPSVSAKRNVDRISRPLARLSIPMTRPNSSLSRAPIGGPAARILHVLRLFLDLISSERFFFTLWQQILSLCGEHRLLALKPFEQPALAGVDGPCLADLPRPSVSLLVLPSKRRDSCSLATGDNDPASSPRLFRRGSLSPRPPHQSTIGRDTFPHFRFLP